MHVAVSRCRQVVAPDELRFTHDYGPLDRVLKLSHVTGPRIDHQVLKSLVAEPLHLSFVFGGVLAQEGVRQQRDVASSHAQRRHIQLHHLKPVIEIFTETAFIDELLEVPIGGGHHTHVDF